MFNKKPATINKLSYSYYPLAILNTITKHLLLQYVLLTKKVTNINTYNTLTQGIPLIWKTLLIQGRLYNLSYTPKKITNTIMEPIHKFINSLPAFSILVCLHGITEKQQEKVKDIIQEQFITNKYTPGSLLPEIQAIICFAPEENKILIKEATKLNIPIIGFCTKKHPNLQYHIPDINLQAFSQLKL